MKLWVRTLCILAVLGLIPIVGSVPALARVQPWVTGLSKHHGVYWGGARVTVHGRNFTHVKKVMFGRKQGYALHVLSSTTLTVRDPEHEYGTVHVRVVTSAGISSRSSGDTFTFTRPTMNTRIQGGLTARQEQGISARVRATHRAVHTAPSASRWTPAMGVTAMLRARSWLGLPYSWAGGNYLGPTFGICAHNGGDMDCHVVGFDCSGLALYAWAPYTRLVHYAATQYSRAGKFHPTIGQLMPGDLVFFSAYIPNGIGHVAIYEGGGMVIQAEQSGTPIMQSRLVDVIAYSGTYRGATRPTSTGRQGPGPQVSSMTSQVSVRGGYVTITGSQLGAATSVSVGGTMLYSFARSSTRLVVKVPAHRAGRVAVAVSNAWGTAQRTLTYVGAPQLSALTPSRGPTTGGTNVVLTGQNLAAVSRLTIGTTPVRFRVLAANRLLMTMPAHAPGSVRVTLYSAFGTSNQALYTFFTPPSSPISTSPARTSSPLPPTTVPPSEPPSASPPSSASTTPPSAETSTTPPTTTSPSASDSSPTTSTDSTDVPTSPAPTTAGSG